MELTGAIAGGMASFLAEAQAGWHQSLFHSMNDSQDAASHFGSHDYITLANIHLANLHAI